MHGVLKVRVSSPWLALMLDCLAWQRLTPPIAHHPQTITSRNRQPTRPVQWCTETMTEERPQAADGDRLAGLDGPLQNRVTPAGELIATEHRGSMYGNRGVLHNDSLALVRRYQVRRWLVCVLEFRGRRRPILRPRRYTELFFLDEAVALAAGHRPCAECRYTAYQSFRTAWTAARALPAKPGADEIDQVLHGERRWWTEPASPTRRCSASCPTASSSSTTTSSGC